jgi:outer membrane protein assembly factor BamA
MVYTTFSSYWFDNRLLINIDAEYLNKVDNYWGVGMIKGQTINKGSLTTEYHNKSFRLNSVFIIKIIDHFFAGIKADINKMNATALADLMLEDEYITKNGTNISNTGIGLAIYYDSRDVSSYPYKGVYLYLDGLFYDESFSGDYNYQAICLDYRQYQSIIRNGSLLAWQIKSRLGFNDVPWNDMSHPGSVYDLPGYYTGQFRDKSMMYVLLEYRHTFNQRYSDELSRHGLVYWIGGGSVFPDMKSIDKAILSTGLGYRFELQPRKNLQINIGFGTEYIGIYLGFNESF